MPSGTLVLGGVENLLGGGDMNKADMIDQLRELADVLREVMARKEVPAGVDTQPDFAITIGAAILVADEVRKLRIQIRDLTEVLATVSGVARPAK
jgi:hypothetical protein